MTLLKETLDKLYREYNFSDRLVYDPIDFPHRYSEPADVEVAGFIASCFAYGKVGLFKPVIEKILRPGGRHPAQFFLNFTLKDARYLKDVSYRFNSERDVVCLAYMLGRILRKRGSLKNVFYRFYNPEDEDVGTALRGFVDSFLGISVSPVYGKNIIPSGLAQLLPSPRRGSACKRMNLFLRWMVRTKDIDFGIWNRISPSKLIIPLDTHIARISRCLGLTRRKAADWKAAKEITESLKRLDPQDPLKYDFALCHLGIAGLYKGMICPNCTFPPGACKIIKQAVP
ncbi:MAG: TIGR02757 family protein [Deferribacteres bacterium]|nr:TIGR02757 family protein [Deferribacteres bacterium]